MDRIDEDMTAYLEKVVKEESERDHDGEMATTMEDIGKDEHELFGVGAVGTDATRCKAGDADEPFPIESVSKAIVLALALEDVGPEKVFSHVGEEPEGDPYHSIATLEEGKKGEPSNPMINAGAIAVTSLVKAADGEERFARIRDYMRTLADNPRIDYNHSMFEAEKKDLNRALFYYMRNHGVVEGSEEDKLVPYFKQTSLEMDCMDLARIAAVFANGGCAPGSDTRLISAQTVRIVLTLMFTTGMYQGSGKFSVEVGIPSKSGVSGAIMAVVPGRMGFGLIGPALDGCGNSIAGVRVLRKVVERWNLRVFG